MEERLKELEILWNRYLNTNAVEDLHKANELNNSITFELCGETFPNICDEIITERIKREYDFLKWEANLIMKDPIVLRAFQMLDCFVTIDSSLNKRAELIISIYDTLKEYDSKIGTLSYRINKNVPDAYIYGDLEKVIRLNDVCEEYHFKYEFIRDMFENTQGKQSPTLPKELDTPKARIVFDKAIEKGYMTPKRNYYQWHQNNVLLAYLCGKLYSGDFIQINKYRKNEYIQGELTFPDEAIESLFYDKRGKPLKNIRKSRNNISGNPKGRNNIDRLFEEATE